MLPLRRRLHVGPNVCAHRASLSKAFPSRLAGLLFVAAALLFASGCKPSRKVAVPQLLTPLVEAETPRLLEEINRLAAVRSMRAKVDIEFLDTSFAQCGVATQYWTADGSVILQRPGQINLRIQAPFIGQDVAQMTSNGTSFRVAVLQGEEKYKRFARGTNNAAYQRLENTGAAVDCSGGKDKSAMDKRTVSALSSLRPQHFTDALLVRPVAEAGSELIYATSEGFEEEPDTRPRAKSGSRIVRGYYLLVELMPEGANRARVTRRFWFDRVGELRLSRVQTYDPKGLLTTDVIYSDPKPFGESGAYRLPARVVLTRPMDRYSLRISYQSPESVKLDQAWPDDTFELQNSWNLPELDLDAQRQ